MSLAMFSPTTAPPRRRGRIPCATIPSERARRFRAVSLMLSGALLPKQVARAFDVSRMTLYRWRDELLAEDSPEADALRRLRPR